MPYYTRNPIFRLIQPHALNVLGTYLHDRQAGTVQASRQERSSVSHQTAKLDASLVASLQKLIRRTFQLFPRVVLTKCLQVSSGLRRTLLLERLFA
jgi:hypothetical protein